MKVPGKVFSVSVVTVEVELTKRCSLSVQAGNPEPCRLNTCAFWQDGGDDLVGGCAIERLELDRNGIDVADFLLSLRRRIECPALRV